MQGLSIQQSSSYRWSFFQDIVRYAKLGYQSIGLWDFKVEEFGFEEAADLLYEMDMGVSSFNWVGGFTGSTGVSFRQAIENAKSTIVKARQLGTDKLILVPGSRNGHTRRHAFKLVSSAIRELASVASDSGILLLLEPVFRSGNPWNFLSGLEYDELFSEFGPDELGLVIDLFHTGNHDEFWQEIELFADRISLVQVADGRKKWGEYSRCLLGCGTINVAGRLQQLHEIGFSGAYEIELHGHEFENADYESVIRHSEEFLSSMPIGIMAESKR